MNELDRARFVRWATPDDPGFVERTPTPDGYCLAVARQSATWRVAPPDSPRRKCRHSPRRPCGIPPTMELCRARRLGGDGNWWAYCNEHAFGKWIEDGEVVSLILLPDAEEGR